MFIDRDSPVPIYEQLAELVRGAIATGVYLPGARLPSERTLLETYGVGRDTVRDALADLRAEGLIVTRRGFPAMVRCQPERRYTLIGPRDRAIARMPSPAESRRLRLAVGVPVLEIHRYDGRVHLVAADRYGVTARDKAEVAARRRRVAHRHGRGGVR